MCGWGHVIKFEDASEEIQISSAAYMREERAQKKIEKKRELQSVDLDAALQDIKDSIDNLNELNMTFGNDIPPDVKRNLECALKQDKIVQKLIEDLIQNPDQSDLIRTSEEQRLLISKKLDNAIICKKRAMSGLLKKKK